jgi:hypothetical protein
MIGVGGAMAGVPWLDAIAAVAVAVMIAKIGWDLLWKSLKELIDTALESEQVEAIRREIFQVSGVRALHMLRTRRSGNDALVDVHILVDPALSVSEGHQIGEYVRTRLLQQIDEVSDVTVHIDPEDDELAPTCMNLPLRDEILRRLERQWQTLDFKPKIDKVVLHYLGGKVNVDVFLPLADFGPGSAPEVSGRIIRAARDAEDVGDVRVFYH